MKGFEDSRIREVIQLRDKVYNSIKLFITPYLMEGALRCTKRLQDSLPRSALDENKVLVAFGGGKDSAYMVAFVRLLQLLLFREYAKTFRIRIVTNRHSGMPFIVLENIDRIYRALGLYDDPDVELLLTDGDEVHSFDLNSPLSTEVRDRNRLDILMTGHRCEGEARPTFCNACNISMINSFSIATSYDGGVDVIVTGDSSKELRTYIAWVRQVASKLQLPVERDRSGFSTFLGTMNEIAHFYFKDIYSERMEKELNSRHLQIDTVIREPFFFSIYYDTGYRAGDHWDLLTKFLNFQFDEFAFSFTESDCANPGLMAHLRGLKAEHMYSRTYGDGIAEYVNFAIDLMRKKDFPKQLIEVMEARYSTSKAVQLMRDKMDRYAKETFDLSEAQLVCMLYSPFAQRGKNLERYLLREQPQLWRYLENIHYLLAHSDNHVEEQGIIENELMSITHLDLEQLQIIYAMDLSLSKSGTRAIPIDLILSKDPHKALIKTAHSSGGPLVSEVLSGR